MPKEQLHELFHKFLGEEMTPGEIKQLQQLISDQANSAELEGLLQAAYANPALVVNSDYDTEEIFAELMTKTRKPLQLQGNPPQVRSRQAPVRQLFWKRITVAASILIIVSLGSYFVFFNKQQNQIAKSGTQIKKDIAPPLSNKAMITLSDGKQILLDSAGDGTLAKEGNVKVVKLADGQISYTGTSNEIQYNTLTNPRGSKVINLTLADGSKVWLNAGSSVKYPVAFSEKATVGSLGERKVEVTGEAYFEVKHNAGMPFKVLVNGMEVQDIGTEFNINSYSDEAFTTATLIKGSVKVSQGATNTILNPGQQSQLSADGKLKKLKVANIEEVTGWKDGYFHFESADLKTILRQFARWYDVNVVYEQEPGSRKFFCVVNRNSSLSNVLKLLQSNDIKFRIEGRNLHVLKG